MSEWKSNIPEDLDLNAHYAPAKTEEEKKEISKRVKKAWKTQSEETRKKRLDRTYTEETRKAFAKQFTENNPLKDPEKKKKMLSTREKNNEQFRSMEEWKMIYDQFWEEDRNSKKLKDKICKEYNIKPGTLHSLINGSQEMNLPQDLKDTHQKRLREWHERWGDYRFIYIINDHQFDSLAEAGRWFVDVNDLSTPTDINGKLNYGNIVWGYFNMCKNTSTLKKGKYAGWSFIKKERFKKEKNDE